jgi:hypothetical protein
MCWTKDEEKVLAEYVDSELINIPRKLVGEYKFYLGNLTPEITIKLYAPFHDTGIQFEQSHFIHTPVQIDAYKTSRPWNDNISAAINQVIHGLKDYYQSAVKAGHTPDDSWLVLNPNFGLTK